MKQTRTISISNEEKVRNSLKRNYFALLDEEISSGNQNGDLLKDIPLEPDRGRPKEENSPAMERGKRRVEGNLPEIMMV